MHNLEQVIERCEEALEEIGCSAEKIEEMHQRAEAFAVQNPISDNTNENYINAYLHETVSVLQESCPDKAVDFHYEHTKNGWELYVDSFLDYALPYNGYGEIKDTLLEVQLDRLYSGTNALEVQEMCISALAEAGLRLDDGAVVRYTKEALLDYCSDMDNMQISDIDIALLNNTMLSVTVEALYEECKADIDFSCRVSDDGKEAHLLINGKSYKPGVLKKALTKADKERE